MQLTSSYFEFNVRACDNAAVYLAKSPINQGYDIILGANGNKEIVVIRTPDGAVIQREHFPSLLNCYVLKRFWLSWTGSNIVIGSGAAFTRQLVTFDLADDNLIDIKSAAINAVNNTRYTVWEVSEDMGEAFIFIRY